MTAHAHWLLRHLAELIFVFSLALASLLVGFIVAILVPFSTSSDGDASVRLGTTFIIACVLGIGLTLPWYALTLQLGKHAARGGTLCCLLAFGTGLIFGSTLL